MADLLLGVKIGTSGGPQTVKEIKAIDDRVKALQEQNKRAADTAKALSQAYDLSDAEVDQLVRELQQLEKATGDVTEQARTLNSVLTGVFQGIGQRLAGAGINALQGTARQLQGVTSEALSLSGATSAATRALATLGVDTDAIRPALEALAGELGNQVTALELVQGAYDIASSGFTDVADIIEISRASVQGAAGGFSDFATVSDAVTTVLNAYGESAEFAGQAVDRFITTQNEGKITVGQYASQIGRLAPLAAQAGVGINELNAFIANATGQGLAAESAISGLRQALSNVLKPSEQAKKKAEELGIGFDASALASKGLSGILSDLAAVGADGADTLTLLFGSTEAVAALAPSTGAKLEILNEKIQKLDNSAGSAAEAFGIMTGGAAGVTTSLENLIQEGLVKLGDAISPIRGAIKGLFSSIIQEASKGVTGIEGLGDAARRFNEALTNNPEVIERIGAGLAQLGSTLLGGLSQVLDDLAARFESLNEKDISKLVDAVVAGASNIVDIATTVGSALIDVGAVLGGISLTAINAVIPAFNAVIDIFSTAVVFLQPLISNTFILESALKALVIQFLAVKAAGLAATFAGILQPILGLITSLGAATAAQQAYNVAAATGSQSALLMAQSFATKAVAAKAAAASIGKAAAAAGLVTAKFALLAGAIVSVQTALSRLDDGTKNYQAILDDLDKQLVDTQIELERTGQEASETAEALANLLPTEPPPVDFLDFIVSKLIEIQDRINGIIDRVPGLKQALSIIPGANALAAAIDVPLVTQAERQLNALTVTYAEFQERILAVEQGMKSFNGTQDEALIKLQESEATLSALAQFRQSLDPRKIGTEAYNRLVQDIDATVEAIEREQEAFKERFNLTPPPVEVPAPVIQPPPQAEIEAVAQQSVDAMVAANKAALDIIVRDSAIATARILEEGGTQEQVAEQERKALQKRIDANKAFLAELQSLTGLEGDDAEKAAEQILKVETAIANDRVQLAQRVATARREEAQKAARAEADALREVQAEAKRIAQEQFSDRQREQGVLFSDEQAKRSEAFQEQQRAKQKEFQKEQQSAQSLFAESQNNKAKAFQKEQQANARAFQDSQQAAAAAFQQQQRDQADQASREFEVLTSEVDRRLQLQEASSFRERQALKAQFKEEDQQLKKEQQQLERRRKVEKEVLRIRGRVLRERLEETTLGPLEQAQKDFADQQAADADNFQKQQQQQAQAFQESQEAQSEAFRKKQEEAQKLFRESQEQETEAFQDKLKEEEKAFRLEQRDLEREFQESQRAEQRAFNEEQRRLDKENAQAIQAILERSSGAGQSLRSGGVAEGGIVQVHKDEFLVPPKGTRVVSQAESRALVRESLGTTPSIPAGRILGSNKGIEARLDALLAAVQSRGPVVAPSSFTLNTQTPIQDAVAIQLQQIRGLARRGF